MKRSREPEEDLDPYSRPETEQASIRPGLSIQSHNKIAELDCAVIDDDQAQDHPTMRCSLPPHKEPLAFRSYAEYESHYSKEHSHRCLDCRRNFPSDHLLGVHIEEFHDPLVVIKRDKGEHTFSCFVEGCERKCLTHQKRRMHMIDKHLYPKNFFFAVTKDGIDGRRSLLNETSHRRRSSTTSQAAESRRRASLLGESKDQAKDETKPTSPEAEGSSKRDSDPPDTDMTDLTGAMSALQFVPPSIRFGRGRAGFAKR